MPDHNTYDPGLGAEIASDLETLASDGPLSNVLRAELAGNVCPGLVEAVGWDAAIAALRGVLDSWHRNPAHHAGTMHQIEALYRLLTQAQVHAHDLTRLIDANAN